MKKGNLLLVCVCTAVLVAGLSVLAIRFPGLFSSMMAFPWEQIGWGLGALSKLGPAGNGAAVAAWVGLSAIPALWALRYCHGKETRWERAALYLLSGALLLSLYGMANPHPFFPPLAQGFPEYAKMIKSVFGVCVWAVVVLYLVLRLIRLFRLGDRDQLLAYMQTILKVLCVLFTGAGALGLTSGALALQDGARLDADFFFGVFRLLAELVPYGFDILIVTLAADLLAIVRSEEQDGIVESAGRLSNVCCLALGVTTALPAASNLLQICLTRRLTDVSVTVNIPILSIALTVLILLFARLLIENKRLRDDNSLFI